MTDTNTPGTQDTPISFSLSLNETVPIVHAADDLLDRHVDVTPHGSSTTPPSPPTPPAPPVSSVADRSGFMAAQTAPAAGSTPPPASASPAPDLNDAQITALAGEIAAAVAEYDSAAIDPTVAVTARQLLAEYTQLCSASVTDAERTAAWGRVVNARQAYADALAAPTGRTVPSEAITVAEQLQATLTDAEARARRPMSGPGAFKKFAAARREFELHLADHGVSTFEELAALAGGPAPVNRQAVTDELTAAEAAWQDLELRQTSRSLADSPATDAFRVRVYRLVGAVVDDSMIETELRRRLGSGDRTQALERMNFALAALGIPTDGDVVAVGRRIAEQLRHS